MFKSLRNLANSAGMIVFLAVALLWWVFISMVGTAVVWDLLK